MFEKKIDEHLENAIVGHYSYVSQSMHATAKAFGVSGVTVMRLVHKHNAGKPVARIECANIYCGLMFTPAHTARGRSKPVYCPGCQRFVEDEAKRDVSLRKAATERKRRSRARLADKV